MQLSLVPTHDQAESRDQNIKRNSKPTDLVVQLEIPVKNVVSKSFKAIMLVTLFLLIKEQAKEI